MKKNRPAHDLDLLAKVRPVASLDLSTQACAKLKAAGIVSALQLLEMSNDNPIRLKQLSGLAPPDIRALLKQKFPNLPDLKTLAVCTQAIGRKCGVSGQLPDDVALSSISSEGNLERQLDSLDTLPSKYFLHKKMQPVANQGSHPFCTGFAGNAAREYNLQNQFSDTYLYRGAKEIDGHPNIGGSWLYYVLKHTYQKGHVRPRDYSFSDCVQQKPTHLLAHKARPHRASGFASLLESISSLDKMPKLIKSILSGQLSKNLAPHPIPISIKLYKGFESYSAHREGLIPMPFPGEKVVGGHAMVIVGFIDKDDPNNPFDVTYFLVRNSWSETWAAQNPLGIPGHALIPQAYFTSKANIGEAYLCLG